MRTGPDGGVTDLGVDVATVARPAFYDLTTADGLFSAGEFRILSGDLVYATESPVTSASTVFGILGSALGLAARVGVSAE